MGLFDASPFASSGAGYGSGSLPPALMQMLAARAAQQQQGAAPAPGGPQLPAPPQGGVGNGAPPIPGGGGPQPGQGAAGAMPPGGADPQKLMQAVQMYRQMQQQQQQGAGAPASAANPGGSMTYNQLTNGTGSVDPAGHMSGYGVAGTPAQSVMSPTPASGAGGFSLMNWLRNFGGGAGASGGYGA